MESEDNKTALKHIGLVYDENAPWYGWTGNNSIAVNAKASFYSLSYNLSKKKVF
jgi:hypothetical protein